MGIGILLPGIMAVIGDDQGDAGLPGHAQKVLVHQLLLIHPMILHLQEIIPLSKQIPILQSCLSCLFIKAAGKKPGHLPRKARGGADQALMVLPEHILIHAGPVVEAFLKS